MRPDKYSIERKAAAKRLFLFFDICFLAVAFNIDYPVALICEACLLVLSSPFWGVSLYTVMRPMKELRRSRKLYKGDLESALQLCGCRTDEFAVLDQGIYIFKSCRLLRYKDIAYMTPRHYCASSGLFQLWVYEYDQKAKSSGADNGYLSADLEDTSCEKIPFGSKKELEEYIEIIEKWSPEELVITAPVKGDK